MTTKRWTGVRIDKDLHDGLRRLRERDGASPSESMRRAIRAYLTDQGIIQRTAASPRKRAHRRKPRQPAAAE